MSLESTLPKGQLFWDVEIYAQPRTGTGSDSNDLLKEDILCTVSV